MRQYVSAVWHFHELQGLKSPTRTPLVSAMMQAHITKTESNRPVQLTREALSAATIRQVVAYGLDSEVMEEVGCCSMVVFEFIFQCKSISAAHVSVGDIRATPAFVSVTFTHRKGRSHRRPLRLTCPCNIAWSPGNSPIDLLVKWCTILPTSPGFFNLRTGDHLGTARLSAAIYRALLVTGTTAPTGHYYGTHSTRIGGFNELLGFGAAWMMNQLDWVASGMVQVYNDSLFSVMATLR